MGFFNRGGIFKFHDSGEDDGSRNYDDDSNLVCNRCGTIMVYDYDEKKGVDYFKCPNCGFIEIDSYADEQDPNDNDYGEYWNENPDEDDDADEAYLDPFDDD